MFASLPAFPPPRHSAAPANGVLRSIPIDCVPTTFPPEAVITALTSGNHRQPSGTALIEAECPIVPLMRGENPKDLGTPIRGADVFLRDLGPIEIVPTFPRDTPW